MTSKMFESTWVNIGFFLYQFDPEVRRLMGRIGCLHLKILKKKQSSVFNQTCLDNDLLPKYIIYICVCGSYLYKATFSIMVKKASIKSFIVYCGIFIFNFPSGLRNIKSLPCVWNFCDTDLLFWKLKQIQTIHKKEKGLVHKGID